MEVSLVSDRQPVATMTTNPTQSSKAPPAKPAQDTQPGDSASTDGIASLITKSIDRGFHSLTHDADSTLPEEITTAPQNTRLATAEQPLTELIDSHLPNATGVPVELPNLFAARTASQNGSQAADTLVSNMPFSESELEAATGDSLTELSASATEPSHIETDKAQAIVHEGLLLLSVLGNSQHTPDPVWNIAGPNYNPGDMKQFLSEKIRACEEAGLADSFGWVNTYDHGGSVTITIIYSEMTTTTTFPDDVEVDPDEQSLIAASSDDRGLTSPESESESPADEQTLYFGNRLSYTYRGDQAITSTPLIYAPQYDTVIPLTDAEKRRRHEGEFLNRTHEQENDRLSPLDWHQEMLTTVSDLTATISEEIIRARTIAVDFDILPFTLEEFYKHLGVPTQSLRQSAATTAATLAPHTPITCPADNCDATFERAAQRASHYVSTHESAPELRTDTAETPTSDEHPPLEDALKPWHSANPQPSVWTLQYALLVALAQEYDGNPALDRYQAIQALAGEILRRPAQQIGVAFQGYHADVTDTPSAPTATDTAAVTPSPEDALEAYLDEFEPPTDLADATDLAGITEAELTLTATEQAQAEIQQRLNAFTGN